VAALVTEPLLAGTLGALVGLGAGLIVLRALFALGYSSLAFVLDAPRLGLAVGGTVLLVLLTALLAAGLVGRRDPATDLAHLG
jgi:ABC-type antimicrobial peptide transport system permease subunit